MRTSILAVAAVLSIAGLSACSEKTQDNMEKTGASMSNDVSGAVDHAGDKIDNGLDHAGAAIDRGADKIGAATDEAAADAKREGREAKQDAGQALENAGRDLKND